VAFVLLLCFVQEPAGTHGADYRLSEAGLGRSREQS
jgi:hypothetical protein